MSRPKVFRSARWLGAAIIAMGILGTPAQSLAADNMTFELERQLRSDVAAGNPNGLIVKYRWAPERTPRLRERLSRSQRQALAASRGRLDTIRKRVMNRLDRGSRRVRTYRVLPIDMLQVTPAGLDALLNDPDVESIHLDRLYNGTLGSTTPLIGATTVHSQGYSGAGQTVVIADSGVRKSHNFFKNAQGQTRIVHEACFSSNLSISGFPNLRQSFCPNGQDEQIGPGTAAPCNLTGCEHGTHVAGIAAGSGAMAGVGFSGVAPDANIIAVQVFSRQNSSANCSIFGYSAPCPLVASSDLLAAADYLIANANTTLSQYNIAAVNLSIGGRPALTPCAGFPGEAAINMLRTLGIATIAASGNGGSTTQLSDPACLPPVISVGATDDSDNVASFSNVAPVLDLFAPGVSVTSSFPTSDNAFANFNGTSMSTPHVTGAFAVLRQFKPNATVTQILSALKNSGVQVDDQRTASTATFPRIQLDQAIALFSRPDLVAAWGKLKPGCLAGEPVCRIKGEIFIQNTGDFAAGQSQLGIYYSTDSTLNRSTDTLVKQATIGALSPGQAVRLPIKLPLPGITSVSGGSVFGYVDNTDGVAETDETNNEDRVGF